MRGGRRVGAGRKHGSVNKRTAAIRSAQAAALSAGKLPLEHLLHIMRDEEQPIPVRTEAAKAAAPYCHPKLSAIHVSGPDGGPMRHEIVVRFVEPAKDWIP